MSQLNKNYSYWQEFYEQSWRLRAHWMTERIREGEHSHNRQIIELKYLGKHLMGGDYRNPTSLAIGWRSIALARQPKGNR